MLDTNFARVAVVAGLLSLLAAGCHGHKPPPAASPLGVISVPTPPFPVARFLTGGSYPQVAGGRVDLRRVNAAVRHAIAADQRALAPYARKKTQGRASLSS